MLRLRAEPDVACDVIGRSEARARAARLLLAVVRRLSRSVDQQLIGAHRAPSPPKLSNTISIEPLRLAGFRPLVKRV
jgi:hypothetical protein